MPYKVVPGHMWFRRGHHLEFWDWNDRSALGDSRWSFHTQPLQRSDFAVALVPGYLVFTETSPPDKTQRIRICSIATLSNSWTPVGDHDTADPMSVLNIPYVTLTTIELKGTPRRTAVMAVHECPLQRDTYRVWLYIPYSGPSRSDVQVPLVPPSGKRIHLAAIALHSSRTCGISYSGHTSEAYMRTGLFQRIFGTNISPASIDVATPERMEASRGDIAQYSGALPYFTDKSLVLCYFE
ncbi:hypothetical protein C8R44DRAFT_724958 [Mycena epipterygia]|nr:hypothetical protein C8R44DRAFT_724958 [Mycena epipterygia]